MAVLSICCVLPALNLFSADIEVEKPEAVSPDKNSGKSDTATPPAPKSSFSNSSDTQAPENAMLLLDTGDAPTAYMTSKYEVKTDVRFYEDGGILTKAYVGLFSWLMVGGGVNVHNVIGNQAISVGQGDARAIFKVRLWKEDESIPGFALGWDGPAYSLGRQRGAYLAASKEFKTDYGTWQAHTGINYSSLSSSFDSNLLSGWLAVDTVLANLTLFMEYDDIANPSGGAWNTGLRYNFDPIQVGLEFRYLGSAYGSPFRLLRIGYTGLF